MKFILLPLITACLTLLSTAGTDPAAPSTQSTEQSAEGKFEQALDWLKDGDISIRGRVSDESKGGMMGNVMIMGGGMGGEPYKGSFFAHLDKERSLWVISKNEFPGFNMKLGSQRIFQINYDRSPYDLGGMANELEAMLSIKRLKKYGGDAKWKAEKDGDGGAWILEAELPKKFIPSSGGMMGFGPKVKSITVRLKVLADGSVSNMEMRVLNGDPFANLQAQMEGGEFGGSIEIDGSDLEAGESPFGNMDADDMPDGSTTVYKLKLEKKPAEKRIVAFQKYCSKLSVEEDF